MDVVSVEVTAEKREGVEGLNIAVLGVGRHRELWSGNR